jgi:hypothetical protein
VSLLAVIGITLNRTGGMQTKISYNLNHGEEAYYIANAGLQHAFFKLNNDPSLRTTFTDIPFSTGSYTVSISDSTSPMGNVLISSTGSTGTAVRTIEKTAFPTAAAFAVLVMDTTMDRDINDFNYGDSPYLKIGITTNNEQKRGIIAFDISSVPPGVVIQSAVFELYMYGRERISIGTNSINAEVHRIEHSWIEGEQNAQNCTVGATWTKYDCNSNWTNPMFDNVAETSSIIYYDDINTWHKWNITGLVQYWLDNPSSNYGMRLKDANEQINFDPFIGHFASGEYGDVNLRPKLTVYYRLP